MAKCINLEELMKFPIRRNHCDKEHVNKHFIYGIESCGAKIDEVSE